ncbi:IclR family transcriptional regulator [Oceanobacillus sp. CFH 90083]|uniref:IclR family transcriptional regulator n=1 Tax=Oceanobacillus sp. CFH 90083 TaxID=2592336 RepID=UPI00128AE13B|nr:IclR family transcriptional regulator [Oceanobacillus sp. CFH 90083]
MENNPQIIRSVQRAIDILKSFGEKNDELTLTEISEKTDLAKSTATRLLATLEENNFVEREAASGKYRLGKELYFLGHAAGRSIEIKEVSKATMLRLREQLKETINLYVLDGENRVCIQQFESLQSVKHMVQVGQKLPLTVGASGKILLAYQPQAFINEIIAKQIMIKSKQDLLAELHQIVDERYVESIEEREAGTSAAAAPIFDINGNMIAALSVSGPAHRYNPSKKSDLKTILVAAALEISTNMGYSL